MQPVFENTQTPGTSESLPASSPPRPTKSGFPAKRKAKMQKRHGLLFKCPNPGVEQEARTSLGWRNKISNIKLEQITQGQIGYIKIVQRKCSPLARNQGGHKKRTALNSN